MKSMKQTTRTLNRFVFAAALLGALASCSKREKEEPATGGKTQITEANVDQSTGKAKVSFASSNSNPQYLCRVSTSEQTSEWKSCQSGVEFALVAGQSVTFEVKDGVNGEVTSKLLSYTAPQATTPTNSTNAAASALVLRNTDGGWALGNRKIFVPQEQGKGWALSFYAQDQNMNNSLMVNKLVGVDANQQAACEAGLNADMFATSYDQPNNYAYCVGTLDKGNYKYGTGFNRAFNEIEFMTTTANDFERFTMQVFSNQGQDSAFQTAWKEWKLCENPIASAVAQAEQTGLAVIGQFNLMRACEATDVDAYGNSREVYVVIYESNDGYGQINYRSRFAYVAEIRGTISTALSRVATLTRNHVFKRQAVANSNVPMMPTLP